MVAGAGGPAERFLAGIIQSGPIGGGSYFFYVKAANINARLNISVF